MNGAKRKFVEIIFMNDIGRTLYNTRELTHDRVSSPVVKKLCGSHINLQNP